MAKLELGAGKNDDTFDNNGVLRLRIANDGDHDMNNSSIKGVRASVNVQTGTTYTLVVGDSGKVITFNNAAAVSVTAPAALTAGFHCTCIQIGAGQVSFAGGGAMTLRNRQTHTKIAGQYGMVSLYIYATNNVALGGDTAA